ncbi:alanine aminotransferase 2 [Cyclospora cayetanensis]|uniref:Aminotransferase n=2 Tax=Cyclospora cayetanensis TaxID=88456 RepID=A0A1D3D4F7_9EIME|nr:alanine aminotransferase 2 [Cyclospora cayetanensis]OEH78337.1 putative aminotransferase [Cyclospora cayetanensis]
MAMSQMSGHQEKDERDIQRAPGGLRLFSLFGRRKSPPTEEEDAAATKQTVVEKVTSKAKSTVADAASTLEGRTEVAYRTYTRRPTLTLAELPKRVIECQYAVRGPTVALARELAERLAAGDTTLPFKRLIYVNIGDPQALGQPPISFFREVVACVMYPPLMGLSLHSNAVARTPSLDKRTLDAPNGLFEDSKVPQEHEQNDSALNFCPKEFKVPFPEDVICKAKEYLAAVGSLGAYSHSQGVLELRQKIAQWFTERDGFPANPDGIFLTDGASAGVARLVEVLYRGPEDGLLIPIPQYPLYGGLLTRIGARGVGYYLDEDTGWSLSVAEMERALAAARAEGTHVRGLVVINPGNPTGQLIKEEQLQEVVQFCHREGLVLLADEVYQENVYGNTPFVSLRKVALRLNVDVTIFSFHSSSKGLVGECGFRGGCMLIENIGEEVKQQLYKLSSMSLCSNLLGQLMMCNLCNPPRPGEPSYENYVREKKTIYSTIRRKADMVYKHLNAVPGITCQRIEGSVFGFPRIDIPKKAQEAAALEGLAPDLFFCLELLKATGIVGVAGSGFGQKEGTFHVRICILPDEALLADMTEKFGKFYLEFVQKYRD